MPKKQITTSRGSRVTRIYCVAALDVPRVFPNKASQFVKELAQELTLQNPKYVTNLRQRLESGKCNPAVEIAILHYGYGKPTDKVDFEGAGSFIVQHLAYPPRHDPLAQPDGGEVTLPRTPRP